jgi:putative membrane protein
MSALTIVLADTDHMGDWGAGWWIAMALMMVVFWGLVIVGLVWLVRSLVPGRHSIHDRDPREVLDHRLAIGEISVEEYRERRDLLSKGGGSDEA